MAQPSSDSAVHRALAALAAGEPLGESLTQQAFGQVMLGAATPADLAAIKTLLLPGEMGEAFKVMSFSRGIEFELPGRDLRDRL